MITETELKQINRKFDKFKIASHMKCTDCDTYIKLYLDTVYLHNIGLIPIENSQFLNALLSDLKTHIFNTHPDRAEYFLKGA